MGESIYIDIYKIVEITLVSTLYRVTSLIRIGERVEKVFMRSKNDSLTGYLRLPHRTECSKMCGTPIELAGNLRKTTMKLLFSSSSGV